MTQEIRHTQRPHNDSDVLLSGEIAYLDSNTIKIGDGTHTFAELPSFSTTAAVVDDSTTQLDGYNKIQAAGTVNKNASDSASRIVFDWIGTSQQYVTQDIATNHPDWLCFITDDVYGSTTDMYTKAEIDSFLANKANGIGTAVLTSGSQNIEGDKYFLNSNLKSKSGEIDSTQTPAITEYLSLLTAYDKNGTKIGDISIQHLAQGGVIKLGIGAYVKINGNYVNSCPIRTCISQDGQTKWTETTTPSSATANDQQIATTAHVINVLQAIYPVGSVYIGTQSTCPMSAFFGTWDLVSSGRALWTGNGSNGNTTIAAGLPNITGSANRDDGYGWIRGTTSGALYGSGTYYRGVGDSSVTAAETLNFDASRSSSIYGNSTTVQPPAYVVNVWRRSA